MPLKDNARLTFRATEDGPWCWQNKAARRLIRERMNGDSKTVYVLSVYDALTEIASDESSEQFRASHPYLATKSACGVSQLKLALKELSEAGLIVVETPLMRGPCTFTLLPVKGEAAVSRNAANDSHDTANASRIVANVSHNTKSGAVATVEETEERKSEEPEKINDNDAACAAPSPFSKQDFQGLPKNLRDPKFLDAFHTWVASGFISDERRGQALRICSRWRRRGDSIAEICQRVDDAVDLGSDWLLDEKHESDDGEK